MTNLFSTIVDLFMYIMYNIVLTHWLQAQVLLLWLTKAEDLGNSCIC
jgi:hypothetical protein